MIKGYVCDWCKEEVVEFDAIGPTCFVVRKDSDGTVMLVVSVESPIDKTGHMHHQCMISAMKKVISNG